MVKIEAKVSPIINSQTKNLQASENNRQVAENGYPSQPPTPIKSG